MDPKGFRNQKSCKRLSMDKTLPKCVLQAADLNIFLYKQTAGEFEYDFFIGKRLQKGIVKRPPKCFSQLEDLQKIVHEQNSPKMYSADSIPQYTPGECILQKTYKVLLQTEDLPYITGSSRERVPPIECSMEKNFSVLQIFYRAKVIYGVTY